MVIARIIAQMMPAKGFPRYIAIDAREPEANAMTPMMIAACVTGLVLILKANFMPPSDSNLSEKKKYLRKRAEKAPVQKEGIQGQCRRRKLR
jgi:hypothetical protein